MQKTNQPQTTNNPKGRDASVQISEARKSLLAYTTEKAIDVKYENEAIKASWAFQAHFQE